MLTLTKRLFALLLASFLGFPAATFPFETPLSDTAVRDAYFLGQRRDETFAQFVSNYSRALPAPAKGPYIQSVSFFTPYVLTAINSSQHLGIYSAQQAQLDHDSAPEIVRVIVQIFLTDSYGEFLIRPARQDSQANHGVMLRPADFWRGFRLHVSQKDQMMIPSAATGEPTFRCTDDGCDLTGATLTFDFPASAFTDDTATVLVTPPEGDPVSVDFDPTSLR